VVKRVLVIPAYPGFPYRRHCYFFEKKSGMTPPNDSTEKQIDKLAEMKSQQENNQNGFYQ